MIRSRRTMKNLGVVLVLLALILTAGLAVPIAGPAGAQEEPASNPPLGESCGLDIVLVMDESTSIDNSEFSQMQTAFVGFVNALSNTPTEFALVDFGTVAHPRLDFTDDATAVISAINAPRIGGIIQYTNWQQGLDKAYDYFKPEPPFNRDNPYLVIFASDGNPNTVRDPRHYVGESAAVDAAVAVANDIKSDGIRIITIGIGDNLDTANLIAISSADALYTGGFDDLAEILANLASELCGGTITVHKVIDCDGYSNCDTGDPIDGEGWTFTANVDSPGSSTPPSDDTDSDGLINFDIDFGGSLSATVDIVETVEDGYSFVSASCVDQFGALVGTPGTDSVNNIVMAPYDIINCTFCNTPECDPPTIQCPDDITVSNDPGECRANVSWSDPVVTGTEPVTVSCTPASGNFFPVGTTIVTCTATNDCGSDDCTFNVTVTDNEDPTITCPSDVTVDTDSGVCYATGVALGTPTTDDNCGVADVSNNAPAQFPLGDTIVTWTVTDNSGNTATCTQTVTVEDNEDPTITCPSDVTVDTDSGVCYATGVALGTPTTDDNCGVADVSNNAPAQFPLGDTIVTWTVTDNSGNTDTCQQTITINNTIDPIITTCPPTIPLQCLNDVTYPANSWAGFVAEGGAASDNCDENLDASYQDSAPSGTCPTTITRTWTVTDDCGNTDTCQQTITINDTIDPIITTCPIDVTIECGASTAPSNTGEATATDNCDPNPVITYSDEVSGETCPITITRTWTATDACENYSQETQTITAEPRQVGGGGPGGVFVPACPETLTVDFLTEITEASMRLDGCLCEDLEAPSLDGMHLLEIEEGTTVLDSEGEVVKLIEITATTPPSLPASTAIVGSAYNFTPAGIRFSQNVTLTLGYNVGDLPEDTLAVSMRCYRSEDGWTKLDTESSQVAGIESLTGTTDSFSVFAILADVPSFELSNLSITLSRTEIWGFPTFAVRTGEEAVITVDVENTGNYEASCTVSLVVNGETRATQPITLAPGVSEQVEFTISGNEPGQYEIVVGDLSEPFTSSLWINWLPIGAILGALLLIVLLLVGWQYRKREKPAE